MGTENLNPLDELKSLDRQVESVPDLAGLKPIFFRLDEIAKQNANDFEVQLAVGDIKQHLVNRGTKLKQMKDAAPQPPSFPEAPAAPAPGPPPLPQAMPPAAFEPAMATPAVARPVIVPPPLAPPPINQAANQAAADPPRVPAPPALPSQPPVPPPMPLAMATAPPAMPPSPPPMAPAPPSAEPTVRLTQTEFPAAPAALATASTIPAPPPALPPAPPTVASPPAAPSAGSSPTTQRTSLPPTPPSQPPKPPQNWKRALWIGGIGGALIALIGVVFLVSLARKRHGLEAARAGDMQVNIATTPPGASVRINGEQQCTSDCKLSLPPGDYQVIAFLDGYEPAASGLMVVAGQPASLSLPLEPQAQSLRIVTDLDQGKIAIDDQPPADLLEGQFILDRIAPGHHTVTITGKTREGSFSFDITPARQPAITGPVTAKNLSAVLVASLGNQAHVVTNAGPLKLAVNGQPEADASPAGVDLKSFQSGVDELVVGEGQDQRSVKETFGPAPMLTAFFNSDLNIGTLIVSSEDNARVFVNDREQQRRTQRGELRIQTIGKLSVRVIKDGFEASPLQTAEVKKGATTRLEFKLRPLPQFSALQITGGTPGAEVIIDQRNVGTVGPDGAFNNGAIAPGDHVVELRRDQFVPRRFPPRTFRAGQTITLSGSDVVLAAERPQPVSTEKKAEVTTIPAPVREKAATVTPTPKAGTMADWDDNSLWREENGTWVHRGAALLLYKMPPKGVFTFTAQLLKGGNVFRGGKIRWVVDYVDNKNYILYEFDGKNLSTKVYMNGKSADRPKVGVKDLDKQKSFTLQIDVGPDHIWHKINSGGDWVSLDSWAEPGHNFSQGKFGFQVQGDDEIGITDFKFQPK